jgi:iron complex outermembrane receptor protein
MGSFGMATALAQVEFGKAQEQNRVSYAHNRADGYRDQSAMRRDNLAWTSHWQSDKSQLTASVMYTNMYYQTPGGLTAAEFKSNPQAARPATPGFPSAVQAQAAIWQQNMIAGLNHVLSLGKRWTNTTAVYGSFALVENAAIRNYESRAEPNLGGRTVFAYQYKKEATTVKWQSGMEYQAGFFNTQVSKNNNGQRDSLRTNDDLRFNTGFVFTQLDFSFAAKWFLTGGISVNANQVRITRQYPSPVKAQSRTYSNEWAPRLQLTYRWKSDAETQLTYSRGFSPPTVGELLPSTGQISTNLEAETGDNYELAQSLYFLRHRLRINVTAFYFNLRNALVQQRDASGGDYFLNAGRSVQQGVESSAMWMQAFTPGHFFKTLYVNLAHTYSQFEYREYTKLGVDYAGKALPGVPRQTLSLLAEVRSKAGLFFNVNWYYNSSIPLNDANTFRAEAFHLLGAKAGYRHEKANQKLWWQLYAGADNLLNEKYSLGNDINAAGNRFFNAAATRNFYGGISIGCRQ